MSNLLSSNLLSGCIGLIFVFIFCFFAVHAPTILKKHKKTSREAPPPEPPKKEKKQEPIYYIVEKKKRRVKEKYTEPKQIRFQ